jgi:squalene-hopene/tetraprenyl-beta-curcumene cyclase
MSAFEFIQPAERTRRLRHSQSPSSLRDQIDQSLTESASALESLQFAEGYWCGELTADSTLESDYVLLQLWMHPPTSSVWRPPNFDRIQRACRSILQRQNLDGGWSIYAHGPSEVNATCRAYTALKLGGYDVHQPEMMKARQRALLLGGLQACNSYTKINLSLFGLYPRKFTPSVPPEVVLLPGDILYQMSSWTRAILVPLSIVQAKGGERPAPNGFEVNELYVPGIKLTMPKRASLSIFFHHLDKVVKLWERRGSKDVRAAAIREAEHWMLERTYFADGIGAIYPSMMYLIMALQSLGYADDHPDLEEAIRQFDNLLIENEDRFQFQPALSPVWDSAYAAFALGEAGKASNERLRQCADWLLAKECRRKGDWTVKRPDLEPSGWAFEFNNEYYPDIDDTAMVLLALQHCRATDPIKQDRVTRRALNWLIGMQSSDGGWAAFDVDNNWTILNKVPFADHNAMLDPSCPDITGRVLEALCKHGYHDDHPSVRAGVRYLLGCQEEDGSWYGRWGVNYLYGSFLAMRGLKATRDPSAKPAIQRAAQWIRSVQNRDGGWGESCASYQVNRFVPEESTPSQTAWALLGLHAAGEAHSPAAQKGAQWLLDRQKDGTWEETHATGTGFPNVFYLNYHMYRHYFPLLALALVR